MLLRTFPSVTVGVWQLCVHAYLLKCPCVVINCKSASEESEKSAMYTHSCQASSGCFDKTGTCYYIIFVNAHAYQYNYGQHSKSEIISRKNEFSM